MPGIRRDLDMDQDAVLGHSDLPDTDRRLKIVQDPSAYLNRIAALNPENGFIFKLFDGQLADNHEASVIAESRGVIFLQRNLVHSYISNAIARERKLWWGPTSTFVIEFNKSAFFSYCESTVGFFKAAADVVRIAGIPSTECWYDEIIDPELGFKKVHAMLDTLGIGRRSPDTPDHRKDTTLFHPPQRQDYRQLASSKVTNPQDLMSALAELGIEAADNAFYRIDFEALHERVNGRSDATSKG